MQMKRDKMRLATCVGDRSELKVKAMGSHGGFVSREDVPQNSF